MIDAIQPITTTHLGFKFRSRLEARWAVAFTTLGLVFDYEPEGFRLSDGTLYLPDFYFPQTKCWAEVKPNDDPARLVISPDAARKVCLLALGSGRPVIVLDGPVRDTNYWCAVPVELEPTGVEWFDVHLFDENHYHVSEGRFYMDTGAPLFEHYQDGLLNAYTLGRGAIHPAVLAARSARFERGA